MCVCVQCVSVQCVCGRMCVCVSGVFNGKADERARTVVPTLHAPRSPLLYVSTEGTIRPPVRRLQVGPHHRPHLPPPAPPSHRPPPRDTVARGGALRGARALGEGLATPAPPHTAPSRPTGPHASGPSSPAKAQSTPSACFRGRPSALRLFPPPRPPMRATLRQAHQGYPQRGGREGAGGNEAAGPTEETHAPFGPAGAAASAWPSAPAASTTPPTRGGRGVEWCGVVWCGVAWCGVGGGAGGRAV